MQLLSESDHLLVEKLARAHVKNACCHLKTTRKILSSKLQVKALTSTQYFGLVNPKSKSLINAQEIWYLAVFMGTTQQSWHMDRLVLEKHIQWELDHRLACHSNRLELYLESLSLFLMNWTCVELKVNSQNSRLKYLSWSCITKSSMIYSTQRVW